MTHYELINMIKCSHIFGDMISSEAKNINPRTTQYQRKFIILFTAYKLNMCHIHFNISCY